MQKVLIANRGEIAVRVIRACRDAGYDLGGGLRRPRPRRAARPDGRRGVRARRHHARRLLPRHRQGHRRRARKSGADAVHPGYGFLSENADFAQAVIDAGLTWIGPSPQSIRDLGDKAIARHIAERGRRAAGRRHQGSGQGRRRGRRVRRGARPADRDQGRVRRRRPRHEDRARDERGRRPLRRAVREAVSAFGRGECFVERYLDRSRHVEAQVLADQHGNVIVVGTRDCSLQRRNQKLVEEAPAPFLTDEQRATIHESAKAICREADYHGAGHGRVPRRQRRRDQLPRGEHPPAGRAPGHRGDQRHRPRPRAVPHRRGREAALRRRPDAARARLRVPHQRRGPGPQLPARAGHRHRPTASRPARACASTPASRAPR